MRRLPFELWIRRMRWSLVAVTIGLLLTGWLGIARAEAFQSRDVGYLRHQWIWSGIGVAAMLAVTWPSYRRLIPWSYAFLAIAIGLLAVVFLFPTINQAHRWIRLGGVGFQPSEFAKVAVVLALARALMVGQAARSWRGLLLPIGLVVPPMLLVLREPDLGTSLIFPPVLLAMLLAAGARRRDLAILALLAVLLMPLLWLQMSAMQQRRIVYLFQQSGPGEQPPSDGYHLQQAKQMMALGGVWGSAISGDAADDPTAYRVPEAHTDSIFTVVVERYGIWGGGVVLLLYGLLVWRSLAIAADTREPYGRLVAVGLATLIGVQALINTGMIVGLLPITGIPLPFLSYGGSGLEANFLAVGLILNVGLRPGYEVTNEPFK